MKTLFFSFLLVLSFSAASAQYGRLEPLREFDTVNVVMRTPKATIEKLLASTDKTTKKIGTIIQTVEKNLELARDGFLINRTVSINTPVFTRNVQELQKLGVDPNYYVREFFFYYPRPYQRALQSQ